MTHRVIAGLELQITHEHATFIKRCIKYRATRSTILRN